MGKSDVDVRSANDRLFRGAKGDTALERNFLPLVRMMVPELVDYDLPTFGVFHNFAFISIKKTYPQQARKVMSAIWGLGQLMFTKIIVVVDSDVNVHDNDRVWFHVGSNVHAGRDVIFNQGPTDPGAPGLTPREIRDLVTSRWAEYGLGSNPGETW